MSVESLQLHEDKSVDKAESAQVALKMKRLSANKDYYTLQQLWARRRELLLGRMKQKPSSEGVHELIGFDLACSELSTWLRFLEDKKDEYVNPMD